MPRRNIVRERNKRGFHLSYKIYQEPVVFAVRDEVFWTEDLMEETTKGLHDSYTIPEPLFNMTCLPNWTVLYPILYLESSSRTTHAGFRNKDAENESVPYPEVQEEAPDSNPDGRALEAEPDGLEVEDLHWDWVLVRVGLTN